MNSFAQRKNGIILQLASGKTDNSPKGYIDAHISDLCHYINTLPTIYTTSSCSGRITLFQHGSQTKGGKWLLATHDFTSNEEVGRSLLPVLTSAQDRQAIASLFPNNELPAQEEQAPDATTVTEDPSLNVFMRFEAAIICAETYDLETASQFVVVAHETGYRESGISSMTSRYIVNTRGSLRLDVPVILQGKLLVNGDYLQHLVKLCNEYMQTNFDKIAKFWSMLQKHPYFAPNMQNVPLQSLIETSSGPLAKKLALLDHSTPSAATVASSTQAVLGGYIIVSRSNILLLKDILRDKSCTDLEYEVEILPVNQTLALVQDGSNSQQDNDINVIASHLQLNKPIDTLLADKTPAFGLFTLNQQGKALIFAAAQDEKNRLNGLSFVHFLHHHVNMTESDIVALLQPHHEQLMSKQLKKNKNDTTPAVPVNTAPLSFAELVALYDFPLVLVQNTVVSTAQANFAQFPTTKFARRQQSLSKQQQQPIATSSARLL